MAIFLTVQNVEDLLTMPEAVTGLWIRWPGGNEQTVGVPAGAREITVDRDGKVSVVR